MSMDTTTENSDSFISNTDGIICGYSYNSGWGESMISDPNITSSPSRSVDDRASSGMQFNAYCNNCNKDGFELCLGLNIGGGEVNKVASVSSSVQTLMAVQRKIRSVNRGYSHNNKNSKSKPKVHECSICGLEFSLGQGLGGHMGRHRPLKIKATNNKVSFNTVDEIKEESRSIPLLLDLNWPAAPPPRDVAGRIRSSIFN
ncbi:zinc finger protein ZAT5-like [Nicotiana tomentosiformis]|uniref:zinc finger protein ZAT5-like n=1 Tax=Nicotiana tomentosiformis TaxID=4098 RepID=UPI00051C7587|nr:zinc finger protein ZAT5-like [Nicotiana tomentosiformis]